MYVIAIVIGATITTASDNIPHPTQRLPRDVCVSSLVVSLAVAERLASVLMDSSAVNTQEGPVGQERTVR